MKASPALYASLPFLLLLSACSANAYWEFGRRVVSVNARYRSVAIVSSNKYKRQQSPRSTDNKTSEKLSVSRLDLIKESISSQHVVSEPQNVLDNKEHISPYFASDVKDGLRMLSHSYSYSNSKLKNAKKDHSNAKKKVTLESLTIKKQAPTLISTSFSNPIDDQLSDPEAQLQQNATSGLMPSIPDTKPTANEYFSIVEVPIMKITCPLTELETPESNIQRVPIRYSYEVDVSKNSTSFSVADIEVLIFQSVVGSLLSCNETRRQLIDARGRKKLQEVTSDEILKFISIDSMPGDTLRINETCTAVAVESSCHRIDGTMTVDTNRPGDEAAHNAATKVLYLIEGFMKFDVFTSSETGIMAVRYLGPEIVALPSSIATSRVSSSKVESSDGADSIHPTVVFSYIGIGVVALALFVVTQGITIQRNRNAQSSTTSSYDEESSSIFTSSKPSCMASSTILGNEGSPESLTQRESFSSKSTWLTSHRGVSVILPHGYAEIAEEDNTLENIPPRVCFDKGFLVESPTLQHVISEHDEEESSSLTPLENIPARVCFDKGFLVESTTLQNAISERDEKESY